MLINETKLKHFDKMTMKHFIIYRKNRPSDTIDGDNYAAEREGAILVRQGISLKFFYTPKTKICGLRPALVATYLAAKHFKEVKPVFSTPVLNRHQIHFWQRKCRR